MLLTTLLIFIIFHQHLFCHDILVNIREIKSEYFYVLIFDISSNSDITAIQLLSTLFQMMAKLSRPSTPSQQIHIRRLIHSSLKRCQFSHHTLPSHSWRCWGPEGSLHASWWGHTQGSTPLAWRAATKTRSCHAGGAWFTVAKIKRHKGKLFTLDTQPVNANAHNDKIMAFLVCGYFCPSM